MSDQNHKRDPIEELFRKKAGEYDISYREEDWLKLENRLDIRDREYANRRRWRWVAAAAILIFSLLGYFTYQNYTKINQLTQQLEQEQEAERIPEQEDFTDSSVERNAEETQQQPDSEMRFGESLTDRRSEQSQDDIPPAAADPTQEESLAESGINHPDVGQTDRSEAQGRSVDLMAAGRSDRSFFVNELSCRDCGMVASADIGSRAAFNHMKASPAGVTGPAFLDDSPTLPVTSVEPRVSVGFVMSPDLSTVGSISNFERPGYKIGIKGEYRLTNRIALTAGVMHSEVRYVAHGSEYKPPSPYWNNGTIPAQTLAECAVLDIPVKLKYTFLKQSQSSFYTTAGLSSYIMLNEEYQFEYDDYQSGLARQWSDRTGTRHWMSNAEFSIGYEFDILRNWSIQAEPFIKVPLREVGWGNVKLYSIGSFISFNHNF